MAARATAQSIFRPWVQPCQVTLVNTLVNDIDVKGLLEPPVRQILTRASSVNTVEDDGELFLTLEASCSLFIRQTVR